ncbi:uncharacterized protein LOC131935291 isoform X2 [Physella acuta]|uniref:uncharacterized protein LOC131935291 isoform X2 n=1 Tax=Physella acuta TaxID=109671 RepID=UPI0027DCFCC1|nr:uncharacterized protein LOC131935291 isoform X2 [Physella acuta]
MNQVLAFSILLLCIICLPDTIICKHVFNLTIEGYEKDCVNYSCRYTGKVMASFSSTPEYIPKHDLDCLIITMLTCKKSEECRKDESWKPYCLMFDYPCGAHPCDETNFPCYCVAGNPTKMKFFPLRDNALYQIYLMCMFILSENGPEIVTKSNIFDSSHKPENWDPIEKYSEKDFVYNYSASGNWQLQYELIVLCFGALSAFYLGKVNVKYQS